MSNSEEKNDEKICVVGLGYVGMTLGVAMADVGFNVLGVEIRKEVLRSLDEGKSHFFEPGLDDRIEQVIERDCFEFEQDIPDNWDGSVYVITVGTPLDQNGNSRMDMIERAATQVSKRLKNGDLVVLRSTVKLGVTRSVVKPILDAVGCEYDLAFCPERTLEGKALEELRSLPQICGGISERATMRAARLFNRVTSTVVRVSNAETAEMIKLVDNAQRDVKFAYANEIAMCCDAAAISAVEVIKSGKLGYPRTDLPVPGPVGGPCLEKDSHILAEGVRSLGVEPSITIAGRELNERLPTYVAGFLQGLLSNRIDNTKPLKILLAGLAFKGIPATDDLRGTVALHVWRELQKVFPNSVFVGYDPVVPHEAIEEFGISAVSSIEEGFEDTNLVVILNNHPQLASLTLEKLSNKMAPEGVIYDFWNLFDRAAMKLNPTIIYKALGSHNC